MAMIYFLPWGDKTIASSRLRVFNVVPHMKGAVIGTPKEYKKGDILVIQKALRIDELEKAKREGAKVVYDIDDNYMDKADFVKMCFEADLVTVGASFFHRYFPEAPVIDDSLDWDGTLKPGTETENVYEFVQGFGPDKTNLVGWHGYGNHAYINAIAPVLEKKGYKIRTVVGKEYMPEYKANGYDVKEWNLETIDKNLAECDFLTFYLGEDDFSQAKGMNKLIKGWAIGLPVFFSYTPEYDRVVHESGIFGYMTRDWEKQDYTKPWVPAMREYALQFTGKKIAKQWMEAFKRL